MATSNKSKTTLKKLKNKGDISKIEDDLKKKKKKTNQSTKINLIGCDTTVNSPSCNPYYMYNIFSSLSKRFILGMSPTLVKTWTLRMLPLFSSVGHQMGWILKLERMSSQVLTTGSMALARWVAQ